MFGKKARLFAILVVVVAVLFRRHTANIPSIVRVGAGYVAKVGCSAVYTAERELDSTKRSEFGAFPLTMFIAEMVPDTGLRLRSDPSMVLPGVSASLLGLCRRVAVYDPRRRSCTLLPIEEYSPAFLDVPYSDPEFGLETTSERGWPQGGDGIDPAGTAIRMGFNVSLLTTTLDQAMVKLRPQTSASEHVSSFGLRMAKPRRESRAVVILYDGQIVGERYDAGFSRRRMIGWSMTKSVMATLLAIRMEEGYLSRTQTHLLPAWRSTPGDPRALITLDTLLRASSGLEFGEQYEGYHDATDMLFLQADAAAFAAAKPLSFEPDTHWAYSSGTTNMLASILRESILNQTLHEARATGDASDLDEVRRRALAAYWSYPRRMLFMKLGMRSAVLDTDASGTFVASSFSYMNAHDWARFGWFYAQGGVWRGERILPDWWVRYATTPTPPAVAQNKGEYGAQWWLNAGGFANATDPIEKTRIYPSCPEDMFSARGYEGQTVNVIPSKKLVIVRLGCDFPESSFNLDHFVSEVIRSCPHGIATH